VNIIVSKTPAEMGKAAAEKVAGLILQAIEERDYARMMVSTGQSQFEFFENLIAMELPWDKIELFHLDEYIGIPETHIASFRKYLKERFIGKVKGAKMNYISGEGDIYAEIRRISLIIREKPVDVGVIGIGENAHIAFNDPPADFNTSDAYAIVDLDEDCRKQQVGEGWFATIDDVPKQAISITVYEILQCKTIVSIVPHAVKANAVKNTVKAKHPDNKIPATALFNHPDWHLYLDEASASLLQ